MFYICISNRKALMPSGQFIELGCQWCPWIAKGLAADCGSKVRSFRQWVANNCSVLPPANAGQYAVLQCRDRWVHLLSMNLVHTTSSWRGTNLGRSTAFHVDTSLATEKVSKCLTLTLCSLFMITGTYMHLCLQCFDTVGWVTDWPEGHPACKNFCIKTPWDVLNVSGWGTAPILLQKEG